MRSAASHRSSIFAGSGAIGMNSGSIPNRSSQRIRSRAFDVRELVSAAIGPHGFERRAAEQRDRRDRAVGRDAQIGRGG